MTRLTSVLCVAFGLALLAGCGEDVKRRSTRGDPAVAKKLSSNLKKVGKPSPELHAAAVAGPRPKKRTRRRAQRLGLESLPTPDAFTERDFTENEQESRDPFRNYLIKAPIKDTNPILIGDTVYLKDYPLAELKLTGIVGSNRRYAMIRDPRTGRTTILQQRDLIAKERARIWAIKRDHLVLLIPRAKPGQKPVMERTTLYVDERRKIVDIGSDTLRPDETGIRFSSPRRPRRRSPRSKER